MRGLILVLAAIVAQAQGEGPPRGIPEGSLPDAPSTVIHDVIHKQVRLEGSLSPSRPASIGLCYPGTAMPGRVAPFWNRGNIVLVGGFLALTGIDAGATQAGYATGRWQEHNPLVPGSTADRAIYFGATAAGTIGLAQWLHRRGHGSLARGVLAAGIAVEGYAAGHSLWGLRQ